MCFIWPLQRDDVTLVERRAQKRSKEKTYPAPLFLSPLLFFLLSFLPSYYTNTSSPLLFHPFSQPTVLDSPCIFNMAASSKLQSYSFAFGVLMKAHRVVAPSLFPTPFLSPPPSHPTPCLRYLLQPAPSLFLSLPLLVYLTKNSITE